MFRNHTESDFKNSENQGFVLINKDENIVKIRLEDKVLEVNLKGNNTGVPKDIENMVVMRVVVRQGMSRDMADMLIGDIINAVAELEKLEYPTPSRIACQKQQKHKGRVYTH